MTQLETKPRFEQLAPEALAGFEMLGFPIYIYSFMTGRICWSNAAARVVWHAPSAEELVARHLDPVSPSTRTRLDSYRAAFARGDVRMENWTYYPKGLAVTAMARCTGVSIAGHDEAMLVEINALPPEALPANELRAIEALRHTPLMITLFAENGQVLMRNPAAERCFGDLDQRLADGDDHFAAMFADPDDAIELRKTAQADEPARRWCPIAGEDSIVHAIQVSLVNDPATGSAALLVAQENISRLVAVSQQLKESEQALDAVLNLNAAPSLVIAADDRRVLRSNAPLSALVGRAVAHDERADALFADHHALAALCAKASAGTVTSAQLQLVGDGRVMPWTMVSAAPIIYAREPAIVLFILDVDKIFRLAAALETELGNEREAAKWQRRLLDIASHDVRTPLSIIDSIAQLLEMKAAEISGEDLILRARRIRYAVKRMDDLLGTTLERARESRPELPFQPRPGDLEASVRAVAASYSEGDSGGEGGTLRAPPPAIRIAMPPLPVFAFDRILIEQAISNILENAIKYSPGPAEIDIGARRDGDWVHLLIRDHGIGIPAGEFETVMAEHTRGANSGTIPGRGLGLSIVRQNAQSHGGTVAIEPTEGPGTTVRLTLPCLSADRLLALADDADRL